MPHWTSFHYNFPSLKYLNSVIYMVLLIISNSVIISSKQIVCFLFFLFSVPIFHLLLVPFLATLLSSSPTQSPYCKKGGAKSPSWCLFYGWLPLISMLGQNDICLILSRRCVSDMITGVQHLRCSCNIFDIIEH